MLREVEKCRHLLRNPVGMTRVGEPSVGISELVKERMAHRLNC